MAEHVTDVGLLSAPDPEIWRYAIEHDAALISKDEDFPDRALLGGEAPVVVWVRVGNTTRQALLNWFDPLIDRVITMIDAGARYSRTAPASRDERLPRQHPELVWGGS